MTLAEIVRHLFQTQLDIINKTIDDVKNDEDFYHKFIITELDHNDWRFKSYEFVKDKLPEDLDPVKFVDLFDIRFGLLTIHEKVTEAFPEHVDDLIRDVITNKKQR